MALENIKFREGAGNLETSFPIFGTKGMQRKKLKDATEKEMRWYLSKQIESAKNFKFLLQGLFENTFEEIKAFVDASQPEQKKISKPKSTEE